MTKTEPLRIGGIPIAEWDRQWAKVEGGLKQDQPHLRGQVGLYRVSLNGRIKAIGTGTELKGGLGKRLSDFHRTNGSGRNYRAGRQIYDHRHALVVEVIVVADVNAPKIAKKLRTPMIQLHKPDWNVRRALSRTKRKG